MKLLYEKIKTILNKPKNRLILFWSTLIFIVIILFFCFLYSDILITTKHSINLLQTIFNGKPLDFYAINYGLVVDKFLPVGTTASYELPIFIIFAIWNIPLWIAQNFFNVQITYTLLSLIWIKLILVFFLGLCVWAMTKISKEIGIVKKRISWVIFAFISSPLLLISLFIMSQYDIIAVFFILLGLWMYIKGNLKWFIIWFAIAITLKLFAIFVFIPLILLTNKKVWNIIKYIGLGLIPLAATKLISLSMSMYSESMAGFSDTMMSKLFAKVIDINYGSASLFCISLFAIAIFCYWKKISSKEELDKFSIYIPLAVFAGFFMFVEFHPYWIILITPFMAIMLFQNMKNFKINIILDIISSISFVIMSLVTYYWCYGPLVVERMLIPRLFGSTFDPNIPQPTLYGFFEKIGAVKYMPFVLAAYITCMAAMLIINFPRKSDKKEKDYDKNIEWGLLFVRILVIVPIPILMIVCYYFIR